MFGKKGKSHKGQAAMEYLMTYGWAILIIVIVLAILAFYLPKLLKPPETCLFTQPGFSCMEKKPAIYIDNKNLLSVIIRLDNQQGQEISVSRVVCTNMPAGDITRAYVEKGGALSTPLAAGSGTEFTLGCYDKDSRQIVSTAGSDFKGTVAIQYVYANEVEGAPPRMAMATITGPILQG